jgi:glycosyltransferase involved in cell wall biosynthesis
MRIVIAAWHLRDFNVGIGRYCRNLIEAIAKVDHENEYEILMAEGDQPPVSAPNIKFTRIRFPLFRRQLWEQVSHLLVKPYDVLHFPYDSRVMFKRGKFITTIHDVKPLVFPEIYSGSERLRHGVTRIDRVITDSQASKQDIVRLLGIPEDKVDVAYLGISEAFFTTRPNRSALKKFFVDQDYILYVGSGDPTKNLHCLLKAYSALPAELLFGYNLVLVGDLKKNTPLLKDIKELKLSNRVILTGRVDEQDLIQLYHHASLFVYPSLYEGFGLPVLEAMASGVSVITSKVSSLPEVVGEAGVLINPQNTDELRDEIIRVLTDQAQQDRMRKAGLDRAREFTWEKTAKLTVTSYHKATNWRSP